MRIINILFLSTLCFFISCKEKSKDKYPYSPFVSTIFSDQSHVIHDFNWLNSYDEIKENESANLVEADDEMLKYEFIFPEDSTQYQEYVEKTYLFDAEKKLDILMVRYYFEDSTLSHHVSRDLKQWFSTKNGVPTEDKYGYLEWNSHYNDKQSVIRNVNIALKEEEIENEWVISLELLLEQKSE